MGVKSMGLSGVSAQKIFNQQTRSEQELATQEQNAINNCKAVLFRIMHLYDLDVLNNNGMDSNGYKPKEYVNIYPFCTAAFFIIGRYEYEKEEAIQAIQNTLFAGEVASEDSIHKSRDDILNSLSEGLSVEEAVDLLGGAYGVDSHDERLRLCENYTQLWYCEEKAKKIFSLDKESIEATLNQLFDDEVTKSMILKKISKHVQKNEQVDAFVDWVLDKDENGEYIPVHYKLDNVKNTIDSLLKAFVRRSMLSIYTLKADMNDGPVDDTTISAMSAICYLNVSPIELYPHDFQELVESEIKFEKDPDGLTPDEKIRHEKFKKIYQAANENTDLIQSLKIPMFSDQGKQEYAKTLADLNSITAQSDQNKIQKNQFKSVHIANENISYLSQYMAYEFEWLISKKIKMTDEIEILTPSKFKGRSTSEFFAGNQETGYYPTSFVGTVSDALENFEDPDQSDSALKSDDHKTRQRYMKILKAIQQDPGVINAIRDLGPEILERNLGASEFLHEIENICDNFTHSRNSRPAFTRN